MIKFYASFSILGEVVEMLTPRSDTSRLLIDISANPGEGQGTQGFVHRTSFSVFDPDLMEEMQQRVSVGDIIHASGGFWQSGYVPHRTTYIDTTFCLSDYRMVQKGTAPVCRYGPDFRPSRSLSIH